MRGAERHAGVALAVPVVLSALVAGGPADGEVAFRFADPMIVESSGLVAAAGLVLTTNDSGDSGRVFAVDPASGQTVGVTTWAERPEDVEALAPGPAGTVWVGDIGDNESSRDDIAVAQVAVGRGDRSVAPTSYRLTYPDGPRDAEALLAHPLTGRLYVASKALLGGRLYAAPSRLDPDADNRLVPVGRGAAPLPGLVTDAAFLPDGDRLVVRTYTRAVVYTFPDLLEVASAELPDQEQGEGLAVTEDGRLLLSSEGRHAPVLVVDVPAQPPAPSDGPSPIEPTEPAGPSVLTGPTASDGSVRRELPEDTGPRDTRGFLVGGLLFVGAVGVLVWSLRRPR